MAGTRGPIPERSDQRRRRNKDSAGSVTSAPSGEVTLEDMEPEEDWHPVVKTWWNALGRSGQSRFYQPSDWATARYIAEAMHRNLKQGRFSGQLFAAVDSASTRLMLTEGDRRRLRLELETGDQTDDDADEAAASVTDLRSRLA